MPTYQYRCGECGKSFERTETITEHETGKVRCPKCNRKKVTQVAGPRSGARHDRAFGKGCGIEVGSSLGVLAVPQANCVL